MWSQLIYTLPFFLVTFCGILAEEKGTASPVNTNQDQSSKTSNSDEAFSDGSPSDLSQASQNSFYPSYSPYANQPLGHSRPFYFSQQEAAYSQRPYLHNGFDQTARFSGYKDFNPVQKADYAGLLGSGNFGVIPGGTFYGENDNYGGYESLFNNGHGRPSFYYTGASSNPKPYTHEQFANFKDFADINTPQYSQYVVVYAPTNKGQNTNGEEKKEEIKEKPVPRNIIESLTLLDLQVPSTTETIPEKKLSKSKRKLSLLPPEKKHLLKSLNKQKSKELEEPLLALS